MSKIKEQAKSYADLHYVTIGEIEIAQEAYERGADDTAHKLIKVALDLYKKNAISKWITIEEYQRKLKEAL